MRLLEFTITLVMLALFNCQDKSLAKPLGLSWLKATNARSFGDQMKWKFAWPNSFYDIPSYRYPYYDEKGSGKLLYGYGGEKLYKYSTFKPIEGYYK